MAQSDIPLSPHPPEFKSVKNLLRRLMEGGSISIADKHIPSWQRSSVWSPEQQGFLALSLIQGYPIGMVILWEKPDGVRVPVDGRQRMTAIQNFANGMVAVPDQPWLPERYRGRKYKLAPGDPIDTRLLTEEDRDRFDDYELSILQYDRETPQPQVMEIFVRLQGGTPLNKAEVRAALGGHLCDFVSELTSPARIVTEDIDTEEEEEAPSASRHLFFQLLYHNLKDRRKSHRAVCDYVLAEHLRPGDDKHWQSLLELYREKALTLTDKDKSSFRNALTDFTNACIVSGKRGQVLSPHLKTHYLIVTFYRAWRELSTRYVLPKNYNFPVDLDGFESERQDKQNRDASLLEFNGALSNAGYARHRSDERHDILMSWLLIRNPSLVAKDPQRLFTRSEKLAIYMRAKKRCEWTTGNRRCPEEFGDFRDADADHIVRWSEGGPTAVANGRLLCTKHNRAPRRVEKK